MRLFFLICTFGVLYGILGFRLYELQINKSDMYVSRVQARNEAREELDLRRGQIFFSDDRYERKIQVALNKDYPVVYANPQEIDDVKGTADALAPIIKKDKAEIIQVLENKKSRFRLLLEKADEEQVAMVRNASMKGIYIDTKQYRFYPYADLGSQVLGFVGMNKDESVPTGLYGIEKYKNDILESGSDIELTIDLNIQTKAEEVIEKLKQTYNATGGTVIIQEPKSGKILALANAPDFNPNEYGKYPVKDYMNSAVQYVYEPGSVFKPITMAAGIESQAITKDTTFVDVGSVMLNGKKITNWDHKAYGKITMTNVIENSVNTGTVFAEQKIGHTTFREFVKKFGFGEATGIDAPDEVSGSVKNIERKEAREIDFATAAFGQGTAVTPMQMINAFSAIANGGLLMRPYMSAKEKPYVMHRVVSGNTASEVAQMMESAVNKAKVAAISGYGVAGKTGTAQIPDLKHGGYLESYIHTYIGFAPTTDPKFTVLLKLDRPEAAVAALTVVPAFRELAQYLLSYYNIPPDKLNRHE